MTGRHPPWIRAAAPAPERTRRLDEVTRRRGLHTVCQSARCPNLGDCWRRGTATFLLLGSRCTRGCRFCAVEAGQPMPADPAEPERVAQAVRELGLQHAVLTSVTRDDLPDGGAGQFAAAIQAIRRCQPGCTVEVLVPDFGGQREPLEQVLEAAPEVLGHNLETVARLYPRVRPGANYQRSLTLLGAAAGRRGGARVKSGLMVGLGERWEEVLAALSDLREAGVDMLTVGQYLSPSRRHLPVARYWRPREFAALAVRARALGFAAVACGPLVRSSYHAEQML